MSLPPSDHEISLPPPIPLLDENSDRVKTDSPSPFDSESPPIPKKPQKNYQRRPKPPFSYVQLIAMAIRDSQSGRLTLQEINDYLMQRWTFFRGEYSGWRNSVRHNLSLNDCFTKVLRDPARPWGKDNYWMLNLDSEDYVFDDKGVMRRKRKRISPKQKSEEDVVMKPFSSTNGFSIDQILRETRCSSNNSGKEADAETIKPEMKPTVLRPAPLFPTTPSLPQFPLLPHSAGLGSGAATNSDRTSLLLELAFRSQSWASRMQTNIADQYRHNSQQQLQLAAMAYAQALANVNSLSGSAGNGGKAFLPVSNDVYSNAQISALLGAGLPRQMA